MTKVAVVGSRTITCDLSEYLEMVVDWFEGDLSFITGGAKGVDETVEKWCENNPYECEVFKPDYKMYAPKHAPLMRNTKIVCECDYLVAFWDGKSRGTLDSIKKAVSLGRDVHIFSMVEKV